ncbi:MAG: glycosyltransferase family 4 protein [Planctomycetes bacterium]|nr:glycosyltransferase family 4 protein [Planctomycetota bacterium]
MGIDYRPALLTEAGIGRAVRELCRALASEPDLEMSLFGHSFAKPRRAAEPGSGRLHRLRIPGRSLPLLASLGLDAAWLSGRASVFHWTDYIYPPVRGTAVLTIHDLAMLADPSFHGAESCAMWQRCRDAARRAARIVCPSEATAAAVHDHIPEVARRVVVVPFGCDHVSRVDDASPLAEPYLVCVGTIEPRKNHRRLLRAWRQLPTPRPRLVVIGRPGWECAETARELEAAAAEGVLWLQRASDAELRRYTQHAELAVYPSLLEGFGFPPLEAMQLGTVVVAGDTPALREVLGDAAVLCNPHDTDALATALRDTLAERALRDALVERGRGRAAALTWRRCAAAHAAVYRSAAAEASR